MGCCLTICHNKSMFRDNSMKYEHAVQDCPDAPPNDSDCLLSKRAESLNPSDCHPLTNPEYLAAMSHGRRSVCASTMFPPTVQIDPPDQAARSCRFHTNTQHLSLRKDHHLSVDQSNFLHPSASVQRTITSSQAWHNQTKEPNRKNPFSRSVRRSKKKDAPGRPRDRSKSIAVSLDYQEGSNFRRTTSMYARRGRQSSSPYLQENPYGSSEHTVNFDPTQQYLVSDIERTVRQAKLQSKTVSIIDGAVFINYEFYATLPEGMKIKI